MKNNLKAKIIDIRKKNFSYLKMLKYDLLNLKDIGIKKVILKRKFEIGIIIFILILGILLVPKFSYKSKESILESFRKGLIEENYKTLSNIIRINDKKAKVEELEPIIKYYRDNEEDIDSVINELKANNNSNKFYIESKSGFLKEEYYIDLETVAITFQTDVKGIELNIDGIKKVIKDNITIDLIPGKYECSYELKTDYGNINETVNFTAMDDGKVNINVPAIFITLYSNFDDAKVFINNKDTLKKVNDIKNFGPIPENKNVSIYIEREFPWGSLKSESVNIKNENYIKLDINMVNDELTDEVNKSVYSFYDSSFQALNERNSELISNATEDAKNKMYEYINEKALLFSNNYEITDLNVEIEKSDFKYEDNKYRASLVTNISYSIYKKLFPFLKTANNGVFLLSLEYNNNEGFYVYDIQKIEVLD